MYPNEDFNSCLSRQIEQNGQYPYPKYPVSGDEKSKSQLGFADLSQANEELKNHAEGQCYERVEFKWCWNASSFIGTYSKLIKPNFETLFKSQTIMLGGDRSQAEGKDLWGMKSNSALNGIYGPFTFSLLGKKSVSKQLNLLEAFWGGVWACFSLSYKKEEFDKLLLSKLQTLSIATFFPLLSEQRVEEWRTAKVLLSPIKQFFVWLGWVPHSFYVPLRPESRFPPTVVWNRGQARFSIRSPPSVLKAVYGIDRSSNLKLTSNLEGHKNRRLWLRLISSELSSIRCNQTIGPAFLP